MVGNNYNYHQADRNVACRFSVGYLLFVLKTFLVKKASKNNVMCKKDSEYLRSPLIVKSILLVLFRFTLDMN